MCSSKQLVTVTVCFKCPSVLPRMCTHFRNFIAYAANPLGIWRQRGSQVHGRNNRRISRWSIWLSINWYISILADLTSTPCLSKGYMTSHNCIPMTTNMNNSMKLLLLAILSFIQYMYWINSIVYCPVICNIGNKRLLCRIYIQTRTYIDIYMYRYMCA